MTLHHQRSRRRVRGPRGILAAVLASALLGVGLMAVQAKGAEPGGGDHATLPHETTYGCVMPLVGEAEVPVVIEAMTLPDRVQAGEPASIGVDGHLVLSPRIVEGLQLVGAKGVRGQARIDVGVQAPEGWIDVPVELDLEDTDVPGELEDMTVPFTPRSARPAQVTFTQPGPATVLTGGLWLSLEPFDDNAPGPGLPHGDDCPIDPPEQDLTLGTFDVLPADHTLSYTCAFPLIGDDQAFLTVHEVSVPGRVVVGEPARFTLDATLRFGERARMGLELVGGTLGGTGVLHSGVQTPEGWLDLPFEGELERTSFDSEPPGEIALPTSGITPRITFTKAGAAQLRAGDLTLRLVPRDRNGNEAGLGEFESGCVLDPADQELTLAAFPIRYHDPINPLDPADPANPAPPKPPQVVDVSLTLDGTTDLHTPEGTATLTGTGQGTVTFTDRWDEYGTYRFDLGYTFAPAEFSFSLLGLLPGRGTVVLVSDERITGYYAGVEDPILELRTAVRATVPRLTVLGLPLAGGTDCRAGQPATLWFDGYWRGGRQPQAGTYELYSSYEIAPFTDCGPLTPLVSHVLSGPGNILSLTLSLTDT